jgi:hypothetical protein
MPRHYTPRVERTCGTCGTTIFKRPSTLRAVNFCSQACQAAWQRTPKESLIETDGAVARIPLLAYDGTIVAWTVVDRVDAAWLSRWTWRLSGGYAIRGERVVGRRIQHVRMHREILGLAPDDPRVADHMSRDRLDNRRANLRIVERSGNAQNLSNTRPSTSGYRGVHWEKGIRKWRASVRVDGKLIYVGSFADETEAAEAAREARARLMPYATD